MSFVRSRLLLALLLSVVIAAQFAVPRQADAQASPSTFTAAPCQFTLPPNLGMAEGQNYKCGTVTVPEDHKNPNGKTISLAVAVFKAQSAKSPSDAVIYLEGGPGGFTLVQAGDYLSSFRPLLANRDLILFDQRGVGYSNPSLYCPELTDLLFKQLGEVLTPDAANKEQTAATLQCGKRLVGQGVNLAVYNSAQNAADVESIRQALGYQALDLYGISYGTRLALTVMRDFPKSLRSSIVDSNVPLEADLIADYIPNTVRVFNQLWTACAADAACNQAYPNLDKVFYATVDQLNSHPVKLQAASPTDGQQYPVVVDGNAMISFLFNSFYLTSEIPVLPALIYGAKNGRFETIASMLIFFTEENRTIALGMYFSVDCPEAVAFTSLDKATAATKGAPPEIVNAELPSTQSEFEICKNWGTPPAPPIEYMPVKSDLPSLVMAGSFDPVTPPSYSKMVALDLSNSTYVEIPNSGHGASLSGRCPFNLVISFFNNPTTKPNTACVAGIGAPKFAINPAIP